MGPTKIMEMLQGKLGFVAFGLILAGAAAYVLALRKDALLIKKTKLQIDVLEFDKKYQTVRMPLMPPQRKKTRKTQKT